MKREEDKPCPLFGTSKDKVSKSALTRYYGVAAPWWLSEKGYGEVNPIGYWKVLKPLPTFGEYARSFMQSQHDKGDEKTHPTTLRSLLATKGHHVRRRLTYRATGLGVRKGT
jgi:hypothetical protein